MRTFLVLVSQVLVPGLSVGFVTLSCIQSIIPGPNVIAPVVSFHRDPGLSGILMRAGETGMRSGPPRVPVATIFSYI